MTDILIHKVRVYGDEVDELILKIAELCRRRELDEWWEREIGWSPKRDSLVRKAQTRLDELRERARRSSWETR